MKYKTKGTGKLTYLSLENRRALRVIGKKFPNKKGKPLSYNKSVSLILQMLAPGFLMADKIKNKILAREEKALKRDS